MVTSRFGFAYALTAALILGLWIPSTAHAGDPNSNGVFRFLTQSLPTGSTNAEYIARVLSANADGPVTYLVSDLPAGMSLDPQSGFLTGRPESTYNKDVTLTADDGVQVINLDVHLKVNASGGGGNEGSTFSIGSLAQGRVGEAYAQTVTVENGVGPYVFGAVDLPSGLTLDGLTGEISGIPSAAGTFFTSLTVADFGENNRVVTILPLVVLPAGSEHRFITQQLNNGEVGTPYCATVETQDAPASVSFGASGLPDGLVIDPPTGEIDGTPTEPGTFQVVVSATSSGATLRTNLEVIVAPNESSDFHWAFFGLPASLVNVGYDRQPPILVAAANGDAVTYTAAGLPPGMAYDSNSGELSGTPTDVGEYAVLFTADDATSGESISLWVGFVVLPPDGGDPTQIVRNFWLMKEKVKADTDGRGGWQGKALYNADRRTGAAFDPETEILIMALGSRTVQCEPGDLQGSTTSATFRSPTGESPVEKVQLSQRSQALRWRTKNDDLSEDLPGEVSHTFVIGARSYRFDGELDAKGVFRPPFGLTRPAFVVRKGAIKLRGGGRDIVKLDLLLGDPALSYESATSPLRVRLLESGQVLVDRTFTPLGRGKTAVDRRSGETYHSIFTAKDESAVDRVKLRYAGKSGKLRLILTDLSLPALSPVEAHVSVEVTIGPRTYYTSVTFFAPKGDVYSTNMP
jgi:hypothetical protein